MRKLAALAVIGFLVAGCSSTPAEEAATDEVEAQSASEPTTVAQSEETAPLVAEVVEEEPEGTPEDLFLQAYEDYNKLPGGTQIPNATDEQLLKAGWEACEQMAGGASFDEVRVVEGETPNELGYYIDSSAIATSARDYLCD